MVRRRCFFATLVGGRCSTVSTLHPVWTHSSVPTLPILFDYSHSVQGVTTGRLLFRRGLLGSLMDEEVFGFEVFHGMNCRCGPRSGQYGERAFDRLALRIVQTRAREVFHQWRAITYWWGVSLFPSL